MKVDCHMHTPLCGHASGMPKEYVDVACERGVDLITFTCHIPMEDSEFGESNIRMSALQLEDYKQMVADAANYAKNKGVRVLCGIEAEVFPDEDRLGLMKDILSGNRFDFVLGSLHSCLPSYRLCLEREGVSGDLEVTERYFDDLASGIASGHYHSMSHPDVVRLYGVVKKFDPRASEAPIRRFLQAAVDHDVCIEVNTSGLVKGDYVVHPDPIIMEWAREMDVLLTIGSDAHKPEDVGRKFDEVLPLLREKGFEKLHYFEGGERLAVQIA